jgi:NDP-hexose-3-ketoreductase
MTGAVAPLRIGVLGCSGFALRRMLPAMSRCAAVTVTAIASRDMARATAAGRAFDADAVAGYDELVARADVDAVYLPLPVGLHAQWIERSLLAGKHVLCEKPLTTSARDTAELMLLARRRGLVLAENFMFLHHPRHAVAMSLVAGGAIGAVRAFSARFGIPAREPGDIRLRPALGGGALLDVGVYPLRAALSLFPGALSVRGACLYHDPVSGVDLRGSALLRAADGVTVELSFGMDHGYRADYEVWGTLGRLHVDRAFTAPPGEEQSIWLHRGGEVTQHQVAPADQAQLWLEAFAADVVRGRPGRAEMDATVRLGQLVDRIRAVDIGSAHHADRR